MDKRKILSLVLIFVAFLSCEYKKSESINNDSKILDGKGAITIILNNKQKVILQTRQEANSDNIVIEKIKLLYNDTLSKEYRFWADGGSMTFFLRKTDSSNRYIGLSFNPDTHLLETSTEYSFLNNQLVEDGQQILYSTNSTLLRRYLYKEGKVVP